jgi:hypothetical protein
MRTSRTLGYKVGVTHIHHSVWVLHSARTFEEFEVAPYAHDEGEFVVVTLDDLLSWCSTIEGKYTHDRGRNTRLISQALKRPVEVIHVALALKVENMKMMHDSKSKACTGMLPRRWDPPLPE